MVHVIYKYKVSVEGITKIQLPSDTKFLSFQSQGPDFFAWFLQPVNYAVSNQRTFLVIRTGAEIESRDATYLGTAQAEMFVGHLFEV